MKTIKTPLKEGDVAPNFSLKMPDSTLFKLSDYKNKKKICLYFYPKDFTSGCTQECIDFNQALKKLNQLNVLVVGLSFDTLERHQKFAEKYDFKQILLSDENKEVADLYSVYQEKSLYGRKFMGIVRSTFLIDESQKIIKIFNKVKVNGHVQEVIEFFEKVK